MRENIIKKRLMSFAFRKTPRISLSCKLVPVLYQEYESVAFFIRKNAIQSIYQNMRVGLAKSLQRCLFSCMICCSCFDGRDGNIYSTSKLRYDSFKNNKKFVKY